MEDGTTMGTEIQTAASNRLTIHTFDPPLSGKLDRLINSNETPLVGPVTAKALREYSEAPEPPLADEASIRRMVGLLATGKGQRKMTKEESEVHIGQFVRVLSKVPMVDLYAAYDDLLCGHKFMPDVSEVHKAASLHTSKRRFKKSRARFIALKHSREWVEPVAPLSGPEKAKLDAMLSSLGNRDDGSGIS